MIPKVIHYCWFGKSGLPELAQKCMDSWKKFCPDYEIIRWDEENAAFEDCDYATQAYKEGKWAFVSDYVRFKALYEHGGVYLDTDIELLKSLDDIIAAGPYMGNEDETRARINPGLGMACEKGNPVWREILENYRRRSFYLDNGDINYKTIVDYTTETLFQHHLKDTNDLQKVESITIYPKEYFNPSDPYSGDIRISDNTVSVHHYMASWVTSGQKNHYMLYKAVKKIIGESAGAQLLALRRKLKSMK